MVDIAERLAAQQRGVLLDGGKGTIASTKVTGNRFGLVLQRSADMTVDDASEVSGNTEQDEVIGGDLPVPNQALEVP